MSLYPNGLRVIRDISPELLKRIQEAGYPYQYRHWMVSPEHVNAKPFTIESFTQQCFSCFVET